MAGKIEEGTDESGNHIILAPSVFYFLLGAAGLGGAGSYGVIGPKLEQSALESCFTNSQIAIDVAAQHGQELLDLRRLILERTQYRYTSEDAAREKTKQDQRDDAQDRRINQLEREVDKSHGH